LLSGLGLCLAPVGRHLGGGPRTAARRNLRGIVISSIGSGRLRGGYVPTSRSGQFPLLEAVTDLPSLQTLARQPAGGPGPKILLDGVAKTYGAAGGRDRTVLPERDCRPPSS
jgi:hypothetical protein